MLKTFRVGDASHKSRMYQIFVKLQWRRTRITTSPSENHRSRRRMIRTTDATTESFVRQLHHNRFDQDSPTRAHPRALRRKINHVFHVSSCPTFGMEFSNDYIFFAELYDKAFPWQKRCCFSEQPLISHCWKLAETAVMSQRQFGYSVGQTSH